MSDMELLPPGSSDASISNDRRTRWSRLSSTKRVGVGLSSAVLLAFFLFALNEFFSVRGVVNMLLSRLFLVLFVVTGSLLLLICWTVFAWKKSVAVVLFLLLLISAITLDRVIPMPQHITREDHKANNSSPATTSKGDGATESETQPNIEANILAWAKHGEYMAIPMPDPTTYFSFLVTTPDGKIMQVCKPREFMGERYALLTARVKPAPPQVEVLKDFSPYEQKRLVGDLKAGLLEGYKNSLNVPGPPYEGLEIQKKLSLTQPLTEDVFIAALNEVGAEMALSAQIVIKAVDDHTARKHHK